MAPQTQSVRSSLRTAAGRSRFDDVDHTNGLLRQLPCGFQLYGGNVAGKFSAAMTTDRSLTRILTEFISGDIDRR